MNKPQPPEAKQRQYQEIKPQANIFYEYECKNQQLNTRKQNSEAY